MQTLNYIGISLALVCISGVPLAAHAQYVTAPWEGGASIPVPHFQPSGGAAASGAGMSGVGAGLNPAAGAIGGIVAGALLEWALTPSGPSDAQVQANNEEMQRLQAEQARIKALNDERERRARIDNAGRMRDSWDQQDKERRDRLQGAFDVFKNFHSIDPFGDFLFHGVPIHRPGGGDLITRHLDPDGLAARAEEWGKELNQADSDAWHKWADISARPDANVSGEGPAGSGGDTPPNASGGSQANTASGGTPPDNPGTTAQPGGNGSQVSDNTPGMEQQQPVSSAQNSGAGQSVQPAGDTPQAQAGGQQGSAGNQSVNQTGSDDSGLRYRQGAFGTHEVTGIPGSEQTAIHGSMSDAGAAGHAPGSAIGQLEHLTGQKIGQLKLSGNVPPTPAPAQSGILSAPTFVITTLSIFDVVRGDLGSISHIGKKMTPYNQKTVDDILKNGGWVIVARDLAPTTVDDMPKNVRWVAAAINLDPTTGVDWKNPVTSHAIGEENPYAKHWQILLPGGKSIGYLGDGKEGAGPKIGKDDNLYYTGIIGTGSDGHLMEEAARTVETRWRRQYAESPGNNYKLLQHDCHAFANECLTEYNRLVHAKATTILAGGY